MEAVALLALSISVSLATKNALTYHNSKHHNDNNFNNDQKHKATINNHSQKHHTTTTTVTIMTKTTTKQPQKTINKKTMCTRSQDKTSTKTRTTCM